jgi:hypothetical protein
MFLHRRGYFVQVMPGLCKFYAREEALARYRDKPPGIGANLSYSKSTRGIGMVPIFINTYVDTDNIAINQPS